VGLDGEKHARAQDEELERTEDYRDPKIHHFLKMLLQQLHLLLVGKVTPGNARVPMVAALTVMIGGGITNALGSAYAQGSPPAILVEAQSATFSGTFDTRPRGKEFSTNSLQM
jgi:hypothetical protein